MGFPSLAAIITAAGKSERFSSTGVKKEYLSIEGHTVLYRATAPFVAIPSCKAVLVTCPREQQEECAIALEDLFEHQMVPLILCPGGENRQESVFNGLKMIRNLNLDVQYVAIHDGARCFVTEDLIIKTLANATVFGGSAPALMVVDAPKNIDQSGLIINHLERKSTIGVQTPQIFKYPEILQAHEAAQARKREYIDDTQIFTDAGFKVGVCQGDRENRKITYLEEIPDAKAQIDQYLSNRKEGLKAQQAAHELNKAILEAKNQ